MKFILLFRDPVERAWSQWRMEHARGAESEPFAWCIREGRERVIRNRETPGHHRVYSYVERGFYGAQLERLFGLFPREQALLLRSEDLRRDPGAVLGRICRFLEVPEPEFVRPRDVHVTASAPPGQQIESADREHLSEVFQEDLQRFAALSELDVQKWLSR